MRRITSTDLDTIANRLSSRDHAILTDLDRTQVLTGGQLQRLHFSNINTACRARDRRRVLNRLTNLDLVSTLDRRIGGTRAGSAGHVYTLTPAGRRLLALQRGQQLTKRLRRARTPGAPFLNHALRISEIYVTLVEASRNNDFHLSRFESEPACWHPIGNGRYLHPDAYLVLATSTHQDCWWLEIDQATESRPRIKRKCRSYLDFLAHGGVGPDEVPPRILFTTPDHQRSDAIQKVITGGTGLKRLALHPQARPIGNGQDSLLAADDEDVSLFQVRPGVLTDQGREADRLSADIALARFLAQKAIIAGCGGRLP